MRMSLVPSALALLLAGAAPASAQEGRIERGDARPATSRDVVRLPDTYQDLTAATLHGAASEAWWDLDESVVRYTALIRQRIAAQIRMPLKDRTLYRNESAARVFWDRDHVPLVQVLGSRAHYPGRDIAKREGDLDLLDDLAIDGAFDPGGDRLIFGLVGEDEADVDPDEDFWIAHPLAPGADSLYRFRSGDTLTLTLPDGRSLEAVQLDVLPRVADVHRITGTLWIEPASGALVRAVYRLSEQFDAIRDVPDLQEEDEQGEFRFVPGLFKPWTMDLNLVAVDYALWDFEVWLPRSMRVEAEAAAGVMKFPVSFDLSYRVESVVTDNDLADLANEVPVTEEVHFETRAEAMAYMAELASRQGVPFRRYDDVPGRRGRYLVPADTGYLEASPELPPPIWDDAPGFQSEDELAELFGTLADLPAPPIDGIPWAANWGFQRPDLVRYNRVEGPAVGARFQARLGTFVGPLSFEATGFLGLADLEPKVRLALERASLRRSITLAAYRDITPVDARGRHLGFGNSVNALLFGRDDGEYFLATGGELVVTPPSAERETWKLRLWGERQHAMDVETSFALFHAFDGDWRFRPNLHADRLEEAGGELTLAPWWGTDPLAPQLGLELTGQAAAIREVRAGDFAAGFGLPDPIVPEGPGGEADGIAGGEGSWARAQLLLRAAVPIGTRWRVGAEAGGGTAWGDLPTQRHWVLGTPQNLRGYPAAAAIGSTFGRARLEVARVFPAWTVSVFGDGAWAGARDAYDPDDVLWSVGAGASFLDGLIRMDLSRGLTGSLAETRLDLYLDAIL